MLGAKGAGWLGLVLGVLLFASGASQYQTLTPVYRELECGDQAAMLDEMKFGAQDIRIGMDIRVKCNNPNPYSIDVASVQPGPVFVRVPSTGHDIEHVGEMRVLPGSRLPKRGNGEIATRMRIHLSGNAADRLLPHFLEDKAVPILMEVRFNVGVSLSLGLSRWTTTAPFRKKCGLNVAGVLVNPFVSASASEAKSSRLGPLICRDSFEEMGHLPEVGAQISPADGNMGFSAAQVAPTEVARGEILKNLSLGSVMLLGLLVCVAAFMAIAWEKLPDYLRGPIERMLHFDWRGLGANLRESATTGSQHLWDSIPTSPSSARDLSPSHGVGVGRRPGEWDLMERELGH